MGFFSGSTTTPSSQWTNKSSAHGPQASYHPIPPPSQCPPTQFSAPASSYRPKKLIRSSLLYHTYFYPGTGTDTGTGTYETEPRWGPLGSAVDLLTNNYITNTISDVCSAILSTYRTVSYWVSGSGRTQDEVDLVICNQDWFRGEEPWTGREVDGSMIESSGAFKSGVCRTRVTPYDDGQSDHTGTQIYNRVTRKVKPSCRDRMRPKMATGPVEFAE